MVELSPWKDLWDEFRCWFAAKKGFGTDLTYFYTQYRGYFNEYDESHQLIYTELHKQFSANLEIRIHEWLSTKGLGEEHFETMLKEVEAEQADEIVGVLLGLLDYERWIVAIFSLLKSERLADLLQDYADAAEPYMSEGYARVVSSAPSHQVLLQAYQRATQELNVEMPQGLEDGGELQVLAPDGQVLHVAAPLGLNPGDLFTITYEPIAAAG
jgi:hypothetical protein